MRDSAGYNMPHTGTDLQMVYSMRANNKLNANRIEAYMQDTYRFASKGEHTHFTQLWRASKPLELHQRDHPLTAPVARHRAVVQPKRDAALRYRTLLSGTVLQRGARHNDR